MCRNIILHTYTSLSSKLSEIMLVNTISKTCFNSNTSNNSFHSKCPCIRKMQTKWQVSIVQGANCYCFIVWQSTSVRSVQSTHIQEYTMSLIPDCVYIVFNRSQRSYTCRNVQMQTFSNRWFPRRPKFWQFSITQNYINLITAKSPATVSWLEINFNTKQGITSTALKERYLAELHRSNTKHEQPSSYISTVQ